MYLYIYIVTDIGLFLGNLNFRVERRSKVAIKNIL